MPGLDDKVIHGFDEALVPALRAGLPRVFAAGKPVKK